MPEMLVKIVMQVYHVSHDEAENMLLAEPPDNYDDWYGGCTVQVTVTLTGTAQYTLL